MKELTKAEEQVMQILWDLKKAFVKDVIEQMPDPKPPYNTISSVVRVLVKKDMVGFNAYGKTHEYYPLVDKEAYGKLAFEKVFSNYFSNSYENLVSFFAKNKDIDLQEMSKIIDMIEAQEKKEKK